MLDFDPKTDSDLLFPLVIAVGDGKQLAALAHRVPELYGSTADYYAHFFDRRVTVETPNAAFDRAMRWAEIAIDQCRASSTTRQALSRATTNRAIPPGPASAGSSDATRSGPPTPSTATAISTLTRDALEFLIRRQRADGKIMHEYSQTADLIDWKSTPYFYASADSTPLLVMAMEDYVETSGDVAFLRRHWDAVKRAYAFTRAHDSDGDGIYENTEGTGWVESWPLGMPHQEIYLAALDQQSARFHGTAWRQ